MEASRKETIECNTQFYQTVNSDKRIIVHQGGSRSGKTYAICQYLIYLLTTRENRLVITIARKTLPALKGSVYRDFMEIADKVGITYFAEINKAEMTFKYKNHLVEFISLDNEMKVRGRKRTHCFLNEANEFFLEDFNQLSLRTTEKMILDFNPSDVIHWIYSDICTRDDCDTYITTFEDNAFLDPEIKKEILRMKERDADRWRVYGLGERATFKEGQIFDNWKWIDYNEFVDKNSSEVVYGLDWGYSNDPTGIVEVRRKNDRLYVHELLYKKGLTNQDIYNEIKNLGLEEELFICDSAEPKSLEDMKRLGLYCKPSTKGSGSVMNGIQIIKEYDVFASKQSKNLLQEYQYYIWESNKDGQTINKIKQNGMDHLMDAFRYAVTTGLARESNLIIV
jgi:phage terminase large subunit|tara:strand:+ start:534 stop:1718 length:1185 start_codon:yes stop_codon:yes gene_type:complete